MATRGKSMPATTEDIAKIYGRIDELVKAMYDSNLATNNNINLVIVSVAQLKAVVESLPKPESRPCVFYKTLEGVVGDHLKCHDESNKSWKNSVVTVLLKVVEWTVVGGVAFIAGHVMMKH